MAAEKVWHLTAKTWAKTEGQANARRNQDLCFWDGTDMTNLKKSNTWAEGPKRNRDSTNFQIWRAFRAGYFGLAKRETFLLNADLKSLQGTSGVDADNCPQT